MGVKKRHTTNNCCLLLSSYGVVDEGCAGSAGAKSLGLVSVSVSRSASVGAFMARRGVLHMTLSGSISFVWCLDDMVVCCTWPARASIAVEHVDSIALHSVECQSFPKIVSPGRDMARGDFSNILSPLPLLSSVRET